MIQKEEGTAINTGLMPISCVFWLNYSTYKYTGIDILRSCCDINLAATREARIRDVRMGPGDLRIEVV